MNLKRNENHPMRICVIADDFTGAAELGAIGLRYGFQAEVQRDFQLDTPADLVVLDTDTRSRPQEEAKRRLERVATQLRADARWWVYKKVDSVMRGHLLVEIQTLLDGLSKRRALLIPANPSLGRTIRKGVYFVNGRSLDETDFADDPEFPATTSNVIERLGPSRGVRTCFLARFQALPDRGIAVGETESLADLRAWARTLDAATLPAGGSEFFTAILEVRGMSSHPAPSQLGIPPEGRTLFLCGSSSDTSRQALRKVQSLGVPVCSMPRELFESKELLEGALERWRETVLAAFSKQPRVVATVGHPVVRDPERARRLARFMAILAASVLDRLVIPHLVIEGGFTASCVLEHLGWTRFVPCRELALGVVQMRVAESHELTLTVKPGSYPWPDGMWGNRSVSLD